MQDMQKKELMKCMKECLNQNYTAQRRENIEIVDSRGANAVLLQ